MPTASVKDQLLEISQDYLGPAAERFIDRQITTHLNKSSDLLTKKDLIKLIDWLKLSFTVLTDDADIINEYVKRLRLLATGRGQEALGDKWTSR